MLSLAVSNLITIEKSSKIYKEYQIKTKLYLKSVPYLVGSKKIGSCPMANQQNISKNKILDLNGLLIIISVAECPEF